MYLPYFAAMHSKTRTTARTRKYAIVVWENLLSLDYNRRVTLLETDRVLEIQSRRELIYTGWNNGYFYTFEFGADMWYAIPHV